jgi:hypothetical protein
MPQKTRAQKQRAKERVSTTLNVNGAPSNSPKKVVFEYQESDYDKKLRAFTMTDTIRTLIVTVFLFAMQYVVFTNASAFQALFR